MRLTGKAQCLPQKQAWQDRDVRSIRQCGCGGTQRPCLMRVFWTSSSGMLGKRGGQSDDMCVPLSLAAKLAPASIRARERWREAEWEKREEKRGKKDQQCAASPKHHWKKHTQMLAPSDIKGVRGRATVHSSTPPPLCSAQLPTASRLLSRTNETHAGQHTTNGGPWERKKGKRSKKTEKKREKKRTTTKTSQTTTQKTR